MEVFKTSIEDKIEFRKHGGRYVRRSHNPETNVYVYERYNTDDKGTEYLSCLEVVKPKTVKQPDGTTVGVYPGDEDFGTYGKCIPIAWYTESMVEFLVGNPDKWDTDSIQEFKKTLKPTEDDYLAISSNVFGRRLRK